MLLMEFYIINYNYIIITFHFCCTTISTKAHTICAICFVDNGYTTIPLIKIAVNCIHLIIAKSISNPIWNITFYSNIYLYSSHFFIEKKNNKKKSELIYLTKGCFYQKLQCQFLGCKLRP